MPSPREEYDRVFLESFALEQSQLGPELVYQSVKTWDSVGHMSMIAQLEDVFGIILEMDDIIDFSSYEVGIEILKKYGVNLETIS